MGARVDFLERYRRGAAGDGRRPDRRDSGSPPRLCGRSSGRDVVWLVRDGRLRVARRQAGRSAAGSGRSGRGWRAASGCWWAGSRSRRRDAREGAGVRSSSGDDPTASTCCSLSDAPKSSENVMALVEIRDVHKVFQRDTRAHRDLHRSHARHRRRLVHRADGPVGLRQVHAAQPAGRAGQADQRHHPGRRARR